MSSITNGLFGGNSGLGFQATAAPIVQPTTAAQANASYTAANQALQNQQSFTNAVTAANGIGNQSQVFNQLQGVANGTGPNPAQAQLAQATGANVSNQAALMAGQRGSGANAGLIARQAAMQGANTQQQAAGQAATLQANQSLNALNSAGTLATNQAQQAQNAINSTTANNLNEQSNVLQGIQGQNNANVQMQSNVNSSNAQIASAAAQQQGNLVSGVMGAAGSALPLLALAATGGEVGSDIQQPKPMYFDGTPQGGVYAPMPAQSPFDQPPAAAAAPAPGVTPIVDAGPQSASAQTAQNQGPKSSVGKFLAGNSQPQSQPSAPVSDNQKMQDNTSKLVSGIGSAIGSIFSSGNGPVGSATNRTDDQAMQDRATADANLATPGPNTETELPAQNDPSEAMAAKGGKATKKVPALVSPGEQYLPPKDVKKVVEGKADPLKTGERIPGKAKVKGNSYANDTVPKTLEKGGVVIPRSVMEQPNPHWAAMKFVHATMAKNGKALPKKGK